MMQNGAEKLDSLPRVQMKGCVFFHRRSKLYLQKPFSKTQDKYMQIQRLCGITLTPALGLSGSLQALGARPALVL